MKKDIDKKVLMAVLIVCIILAAALLIWKNQALKIITDKTEYNNGGSLKVKIKNPSFKNICFSSCYPYYLEWKIGSMASVEWGTYSYESCSSPDLTENCIGPFKLRAFETALPKAKIGAHRIAISICEDCAQGQEFIETKRFYSNEFEIR